METASIRSKLHEYIDMADERKLEAIYVILENDIEQDTHYTASDLALLHELRNTYLQGNAKTYSPAESLELARKSAK